MKNILALDTATPVCSVAFRGESGRIISKLAEGKGIHSEAVFTFSRDILAEANITVSDLGGVLISGGPGSYTGLRIASSAVKGLLFETRIPVFAVNCLAALAYPFAMNFPRVHAVIDARRTHLYHQVFSIIGGLFKAEDEPQIRELAEFSEIVKEGDIITGTGFQRLPGHLQHRTKKPVASAPEMILMYIDNIAGKCDPTLIQKTTAIEFTPKYQI